jgi:T5SS/PEP-CTERM-associated repeat protein
MITWHIPCVRRGTLSIQAAFLLAALTLFSPTAGATNFFWNAGDGLFPTASNWSQSGDPDGVPDADDTIIFSRGDVPPYTVSYSYLFPLPEPFEIPYQATVDRLEVGTNTVTFTGFTLRNPPPDPPTSSSLTIDSTDYSETDRGMIIGKAGGDVAVLTSSLPGGISTVYATLGWDTGSSGTLNLNGGAFNITGNNVGGDELIVGELGTGAINVNNGSRMRIAGGTSLGYYNGATGTVSVIGPGSSWISGGDLFVGAAGTGALHITNGGFVSNDGTYVGSAGVGTATVDGMGSMWWSTRDFIVGRQGHGTLHIINGGLVQSDLFSSIGQFSGSVGEVLVGSDATWTNRELSVGFSGTGTLTIEDGGNVSSSLSGTIGLGVDSTGTVTVTGADSSWTNNGTLSVGASGMGTLTIEAGGSVSNSGGTIGAFDTSTAAVTVTGDDSTWTNNGELKVGSFGTGTLTVADGGSVSNTNGFVGSAANSTGMVTVTGVGSNWANSMFLFIGDAGMGTLRIENGGSVSSAFAFVGRQAGATGKVTLTGADSTWSSTTLEIGGDGTGTLNILDGGAVTDNAGRVRNGVVTVAGADPAGNPSKWTNGELAVGASKDLTGELIVQDGGSVSATFANIGSDAGSIGMARVSGADSTWTNVMFIRVGDSGMGTLRIEDGGSVSSDRDGYLGNMMDSEGTATVTGAGSTWTIAEELRVGNFGKGTLIIQLGGNVSNENGSIAHQAGSEGTVTVTDATWTNVGELRVGNAGMGTLHILDGAVVTNTHGLIGALADSVGTARVAGSGSSWTMSGRLSIGGNAATATNGGTGTLRIQAGASVNVAQDIVLFPDGLVRFEGGTLSTMAVSFQGGGQFDWTGGTLHVGLFNGNLVNQGGMLAPGQPAGSTTIIGNYTQQSAGTLQIEIGGTLVNTEHDFVNVTGNTILGGALELALIDDFVPSATHTFTVFSAGNLLNFFSNVTNGQRLTTVDGMGSFLVYYGPTSTFNPNQIVLTNFALTGLAGDYNNDGRVDAADYVVWRKNDDTQEGYDAWRANFGRTAGTAAVATGSASANAAIPEPSSATLILCLATTLFLIHDARRKIVAEFGARTC